MNVKAENLNLSFGDHAVLKDINFELNSKKIYGFLGRNGAGKTSLLSILASFREPSSGTITINGEVPFENAEVMRQVTFMYDKDYKDNSDNVKTMFKNIQRYRPNFDMDYAEYLIDCFKLDKKKAIKKFSKGMKSAVSVIVGLASRTPITIFDEVYLGMDELSRNIFYKELLQDQVKHPRIIILSTHLISEMDYLFDEVLLLKKGEIILQEEYDLLISKGVAVTGKSELVDSFVQSKEQIHVQHLGAIKSVIIYGQLSDENRNAAMDNGLEIGSVSLHDLFIHFTKEDAVNETESRFS